MGLDNITLAAAKSYVKRSLQGQGALQGSPGKDGVSPTITTTPITVGHKITITDKNGTQSFDVVDGSQDTSNATLFLGTGNTPPKTNDVQVYPYDNFIGKKPKVITGEVGFFFADQLYKVLYDITSVTDTNVTVKYTADAETVSKAATGDYYTKGELATGTSFIYNLVDVVPEVNMEIPMGLTDDANIWWGIHPNLIGNKTYTGLAYNLNDEVFLLRVNCKLDTAGTGIRGKITKVIKIADLANYYNKQEVDSKITSFGGSNKVTYITGNSKENPFVWNNYEPGTYIFDTYDIWVKATDDDVYTYDTPQLQTCNGVVVITDHVTEDSVEDTKLGYYSNRGFRLYNVKFSPNSPTAGRIFRMPVSENEPTLNPVFASQNGTINVNCPILQAPKSNAVASWYNNQTDNGQYLATIDFVKKYAGSGYFVDLTDFKNNYETNCSAPMYSHSFKQIIHNIMYLDYAKQGSFMVGDIYTSDPTVPCQYMNCTFYVTVKNENYQQIFIEGYATDDPISKRYYTIMTRPSPFSITDWQDYEWKAEITKDYVDTQIANCIPSINMKVIDMGDKTTLINIDESFPTDGKNSYIIRGAFVDTTILLLDQEPVHVQRFGTQLFVTTMNGKVFVFLKNSSTGVWYHSGTRSFLNGNDVLTRTNTDPYNPTANYHPATKRYVDNKVENMFSFNADGELVVTIGDVSKTFVPKAEE